jgi:hypothetical protein
VEIFRSYATRAKNSCRSLRAAILIERFDFRANASAFARPTITSNSIVTAVLQKHRIQPARDGGQNFLAAFEKLAVRDVLVNVLEQIGCALMLFH